ncbi:MAG: hypothetical protein ACE5OR_07410 [bacterium]
MGKRAPIEGVCCPMWQNHIVRHLMDAIDEVQRMQAKVLSEAGSELLKGTRSG